MNTFLLLQITFGIIIGKCIAENAALFNLIVNRFSQLRCAQMLYNWSWMRQ